jgi:chromosome segregation ATPase
VIARRLNQLSKEDRTIERLVKDAMAGTAELTANLEQRRADLQTQRTLVQAKIDALVESIADRRKALKSVGKRIVELEEQKEQLDDEVLDLDMEIEATKRKAVSAGALSASLTTFGDLYQEAVPGEHANSSSSASISSSGPLKRSGLPSSIIRIRCSMSHNTW